MKIFQHAPSYKTIIAGITLLVSIGIVAYNAPILWRDRHKTVSSTPTPIPTETINYTTMEPEETQPDCPSYKVADHEPRKIEITSVGINGCIQKVDIDQNNAIAAPSNVHLGGWYTKTVSPGQKGVSLIDGHVQGRYGTAIFAHLDRIKPGDHIRIQLGSGLWKEFETVDIRSYPVSTVMQHLLDPLSGAESQLTLITCAGIYDKQTREYSNRVVVRAKLIL